MGREAGLPTAHARHYARELELRKLGPQTTGIAEYAQKLAVTAAMVMVARGTSPRLRQFRKESRHSCRILDFHSAFTRPLKSQAAAHPQRWKSTAPSLQGLVSPKYSLMFFRY